MSYLPVEVILEILKTLPVESLIRCRSVCKTWSSLISNPSFISTHLQTALSKPHSHLLLPSFFYRGDYALLFYNDDFHEFNQLPFPATAKYFRYRVVGCCHGLVFLWSLLRQDGLNFIFWNPYIHKYITLPNPSIHCTINDAHFICGFGFDSRINDYKLLIVALDKTETLGEAYLFSLNENSWKRVTAISPKYAVDKDKPSAFVNGAAHWVGYQRGKDWEYRNTILGFDISAKEFLVIGLPESLIASFPMALSIIKYEESSIALLESYWDYVERLDVWFMKEYGVVGSWSKVLHLSEQIERVPDVLGFRKNAQVLLEVDEEMASLDLKSQPMENLGIKATRESFVDSYVESLVLLDKALDPCSQ